MEEKKEQAVAEFADIVIKNITKYVVDHEDELADAIITDELDDSIDKIEDAFGCEVFGRSDNEEFNEMFPRILMDRLSNYMANPA